MKKVNPRQSESAFTLIELMVVSALLAVISLALFSTFSSGVKLYKRAGQFVRTEDSVIFLERFSADVRNAFMFSGIDFTGTDKRVEMAAIVTGSALAVRTVGQVAYVYDPDKRTMSRFQSDYSQLYERRELAARQVITGVLSAEFSYYVRDPEKKTYYWKSEFKPEQAALPAAVRLELEVEVAGQPRTFTRTVNVPLSEASEKNE